MIADGTLTKLLEALLSEKMQVKKLFERVGNIEKEIAPMEIGQERKIINRKILLYGSISGKTWLYADSIIVPDRLEKNFKERLLSSNETIGKLLLEQKMETFREIIATGREPAGGLSDHFQIKNTDWLLYRTYLVFFKRKAIMMITEKFPEKYFT